MSRWAERGVRSLMSSAQGLAVGNERRKASGNGRYNGHGQASWVDFPRQRRRCETQRTRFPARAESRSSGARDSLHCDKGDEGFSEAAQRVRRRRRHNGRWHRQASVHLGHLSRWQAAVSAPLCTRRAWCSTVSGSLWPKPLCDSPSVLGASY